MLETLPSIIAGTNNRIPQDESLVTYAYNLRREEEKIDWNKTMEEIEAQLRAFLPDIGLYTTIQGKQLKVFGVQLHHCNNFETHHGNDENGTIVLQ